MKDRVINIFGAKYNVYFVKNRVYKGEPCEGQTYLVEKEIYVSTHKPSGKKYSKKHIMNVYYHEVFHALLYEGQYKVEMDNEALVEYLAKCLTNVDFVLDDK